MSGKICFEVVISTTPLLFRNCSQIFRVTETGNKGPVALLCLFLCYTYLSLLFRTFSRVSLWLQKENSFFGTEGIGSPNTENGVMTCDLEFLGSYCFYLSFIYGKGFWKYLAQLHMQMSLSLILCQVMPEGYVHRLGLRNISGSSSHKRSGETCECPGGQSSSICTTLLLMWR